jgi:Flp pilus assembly protein TadB
MVREKNVLKKEVEILDEEIQSIKSDSSKFNLAIWCLLGLFGIVFISQLTQTSALMFLIAIFIVIFLSLKTRYKRAENKLNILKGKLKI